SAVPASTPTSPGTDLTRVPRTTAASAAPRTRSRPNLAAIRGVSGATARVRASGIVVSSDRNVSPWPVSDRISGMSGPSETVGILRLSARSSMDATASAGNRTVRTLVNAAVAVDPRPEAPRPALPDSVTRGGGRRRTECTQRSSGWNAGRSCSTWRAWRWARSSVSRSPRWPRPTPVLALLLYATFLGFPFVVIGRAFREWRFLATLFAVNVGLVPPVAWLLSRIVTHDPVLVVGVLLVLLAPCIDYVIVFTGLAGGDVRRLLAATPVLMLAQMALLPVFLWALVGGDTVAVLDPGPFVEAFLLLIVLPLAAAAVTQLISRRAPVGRAWEACVASAMVPLMVATLAVVVASQISAVSDQLGALAGAVSVYVAFAAVLAPA